jgi:hypothetical protein
MLLEKYLKSPKFAEQSNREPGNAEVQPVSGEIVQICISIKKGNINLLPFFYSIGRWFNLAQTYNTTETAVLYINTGFKIVF